jgi:tRNA-2-methylthio-N6-dimethylallyladenosine synthase
MGLDKRLVYLEGVGCNRRALEKVKLRNYLELNGYRFTFRPSRANYLILFTCAFKREEEDFSLKRLQALKRYPGQLIVFGCLPDISPFRVGDFASIRKVAPKDLDRIDSIFEGIQVRYADIEDPKEIRGRSFADLPQKIREASSRIRTFADGFHRLARFQSPARRYCYLFACTGCMGSCTYCAIRRAVGSTKSKPVPSVVAEFREGVRAGYRHFVLLGDDLGSYGIDLSTSLPALMAALQRESGELGNVSVDFHLKEVHPKYLLRYEEDLPGLFGPGNVKSLLCPIQTGSPRILGLMSREHTVDDVKRIVGKVNRVNNGVELSTQIIVGFPTETELEFEATLQLVASLRFRWLAVFPFDPKPGTPAAAMTGQIPPDVIQRRTKKASGFFRRHGIKALSTCPW